ncbi:MAG: tRNA-dihydrouridine synthase family protein [Euryarchaeota archaeon]|jgi:tRNA-dihydrouridine synthase B|nr:tRNA-dihydrouridine synthase family protein [Euryarchaeota archaeon]
MVGEAEPVPLFLAPMSGVTDLAYRLLARECGADITITEFTAAAALTRQDARSWHKVECDPRENPFIPQIFGGNIDEMVKSCDLLQEMADMIDLNFGCPAPKVTRHCAGAALMGKPDELVEMVAQCVEISQVPITVKMRLGTGNGATNALELAKRVEDVGASRICVHGRTLKQRYSGESDWQAIRKIVNAVDVPVIANGDIVDADSAARCLEITGAAGLMIGRAAIGRPMIFHQIKSELGWNNSLPQWMEDNGGDDVDTTAIKAVSRLWAWRRYVELDSEVNDGKGSKNRLRHGLSFTKGLPGGKAFRIHLHGNRKADEVAKSVEKFFIDLQQ